MEPASVEYRSRIDNAQIGRHFSARAELFLDEGLPPVEIPGSMIYDYSYKCELAAESSFPLGRVANSLLQLNLNNVDRRFSLNNTASPYYGKLVQNVLLKLYTSLELADGSFEEKLMCTMYTTEWDANSSDVISSVVCRDRLYALRKCRLPMLPLMTRTTLRYLFYALFLALGLSSGDYEIDPTLVTPIPFGWLPGKTVGDALDALTVTGMCTVYVDRRNKIIVTKAYKRVEAGRILSGSITGNAQIKSIVHSQASYKAYDGVAVEYFTHTATVRDTLSLMSDQSLIAGDNVFDNIELSTEPAIKVTNILLHNTKAAVRKFSYGAMTASMLLNAPSAEEHVDIEIQGVSLESVTQTAKVRPVGAAPEKPEDNILTVSSELIQDRATALRYGQKLCQIVSAKNAFITASLRGDLTFDVGDVYLLNVPKQGLVNAPYYFTRLVFKYNGALSCEASCTRFDDVTVKTYAPVGPGLYVEILH